MKIVFHILLFAIIFSSCIAQKLSYLEMDKPDQERKKFAPGLISKNDVAEFGSVFSKNVDKFYFAIDRDGKAEIWFTRMLKGVWMPPRVIMVDDKFSYNDPFLNPEENRLYFISNMPRDDKDTIQDYDIWYSEILDDGKYSDPINAGPWINTDKNEYYISFTKKGAMYFASNKESAEKRKHNFDIYTSENMNGIYGEPNKLSDSINTRAYEADVFIDPDEKYIIFVSARRSGLGRGDLYISFKDENGVWMEAKNMGTKINTEGHEICPFVSHDGKYMFYTSNQDIYWISTKMFDELR